MVFGTASAGRALRAALLLLCVAAAGRGQERSDRGAAVPLRLVGGAATVRGRVTAGERSLPVHLLVDAGSPHGLLLHENVAASLELPRGGVVGVSCGELTLEGIRPSVRRVRLLERLTAAWGRALDEVPVSGILGLGAFGGRRVVLDFGAGELRAGPGAPPPAQAEERTVRMDEGRILTTGARTTLGTLELPVRDGEGRLLRAGIDTLQHDTWIRTDVRVRPPMTLGSVDLLGAVALRPGSRPAERPGAPELLLGTGFLSNFVVTLDASAGACDLEPFREVVFPRDDAAAFLVLGSDDPADLADFLDRYGGHRLALEVARRLVALRAGEDPPRPDALAAAFGRLAATAPERARVRVLLDVFTELVRRAPEVAGRVQDPVLDLALESAEREEDPTALARMRSELGGALLEAGRLDDAYRQLLSAALRIGRDGLVNLRLGRCYEAMGRLERAWSRYLQAAISEEAAAEGLAGLRRLREEHGLDRPFDVEELEGVLEGRVPAFEPPARWAAADGAPAPSRVVLVELFTGAQCRPCAAAELAAGALPVAFGDHVALLAHHLPVPAPEPLVTRAAAARAGACGVRATPTVLVDGRPGPAVGGRVEDAAVAYRELRQVVEDRLRDETPFTIGLEATLEDGRLDVRARVEGPEAAGLVLRLFLAERTLLFPGRNGIVFHRYVTRADLAPAGLPVPADGPRELGRSVELSEVERAVARTLESLPPDALAVRPGGVTERGAVVIAFLEDGSGLCRQAARLELEPRSWK